MPINPTAGARWLLGASLAGALWTSAPGLAHAPDAKVFESKPNMGARAPAPTSNAGVLELEQRYREALEKSDLAAFGALHHKDVVIFESGHKNVGWQDYATNHLQPEIDETKSFRFTKWESAARVYGDTAVVIADIGYAIELKDGAKHEAVGVVTLVLRPRVTGTGTGAVKGWEVVHTHWSTARKKG